MHHHQIEGLNLIPGHESSRLRRLSPFLFTAHLHARLASVQPHLRLLHGTFGNPSRRARLAESGSPSVLPILETHPRLFTALRLWIAAGGAITLVLSPGEQWVAGPENWRLLREVLPTLNDDVDGQPLLEGRRRVPALKTLNAMMN